jgi:hypothetical protein
MGEIRLIKALISVWFFAVVVACESGDGLPAGVVAKIGDRLIGVGDLVEGAKRMYGEQAEWDVLDEERQIAVLDALVASELLALEGMSRGLDRESPIREELVDLQRKLLAEEYFDRQVWRDLEISDGEVRERFEEWGAGEQRRLAHILCRSREEGNEVLQALAEFFHRQA